MKQVIVRIFGFLLLVNGLSCKDIERKQELVINATNHAPTKLLSKKDKEIQERIESYVLLINYNTVTDFELNNKQTSSIINWAKRLERDSLFTLNKSKKGEFIIDLKATISVDVNRVIGVKRMDELEAKLNKVLGYNLNGHIPLYKTIKSLRYGNGGDSYVVLTINRLMY